MAVPALTSSTPKSSAHIGVFDRVTGEHGAALIEYTVATVILVLGMVIGILIFEVALTGKINEGRCTYTDYNLPDPHSSGSASSC